MTETSPVSFQSSTDDPLDKRVSTVGRIQPHLEVKMVDADRPQVLPVGEKGELLVRGYSVMQGYWGDEERTREACATAGCTPATWPPSTPRATATSSAASRTW
jgi:fatty-acyl-CoA synthase